MFYILPLFFLVSLLLSVVLGKVGFAELLSEWLWITFFFAVLWSYTKIISNNKFTKEILKGKLMLTKYSKYLILPLFLLFVSWISLKDVYYFGGDDTRLYFLYPREYYQNFVSKVVSDNALSNTGNFLPAISVVPFVLFAWMFKTILPFVNLQILFYTLNVLLGVYFFYKLLLYVFKEEKYKAVFLLVSLLYVFSIFNIYTLYNSRLIAVFLISLFPLIIYLFIRACVEKRFYYIAIVSILITVFGVQSVSLFWFLASLLCLLPFLLYYLLPHWKRVLLYSFGLIGLLILLNAYWLIYLPHTTLLSRTESNSVVSEKFLTENAEGVRSTTQNSRVFYPLLNLYLRGIQERNSWPYLPIYRSWYINILPINIFFILVIFTAGIFARRDKKFYQLYVVGAISFILSLYLFTVSIGETKFGNIGIESFIWMINNIPGFVIFRNMYDKFGHALSISFAFVFAASLCILLNTFSSLKIKYILLTTSFFLTLLNAKPFLLDEFNKLPVWRTQHLYQGTTSFNHDYSNLVSYIKNQEFKGRYAFIPLSGGNVIPIQDSDLSNHYYVGVSPLLILSGKNDYSGILSFGSYEDELYDAILDRDYEEVGRIFQNMNVAYVIHNKDIPAELHSSYMYDWEFFDAQREEFMHEVAGEKIQDFGNRYTLYAINPKHQNDKISIEGDPTGNITYKKLSSHDFIVNISNIVDGSKLNFLETKNDSWQLQSNDNQEILSKVIYSDDQYRNIWELRKAEFSQLKSYSENPDGTFNAEFHIYFKPYNYYFPSLVFSSFTVLVLFLYIIISFYKERKSIQ